MYNLYYRGKASGVSVSTIYRNGQILRTFLSIGDEEAAARQGKPQHDGGGTTRLKGGIMRTNAKLAKKILTHVYIPVSKPVSIYNNLERYRL